MSKLSNFGLPDVGLGILHPKLQNRFRVTFNGESNDILGRQVVSTGANGDYFVIDFEDDVGNLLIKKLASLNGRGVKFKIEALDGNEEVQTTWLYEATLVVFTPAFDYANAGTHKITARFKINQWSVEV